MRSTRWILLLAMVAAPGAIGAPAFVAPSLVPEATAAGDPDTLLDVWSIDADITGSRLG